MRGSPRDRDTQGEFSMTQRTHANDDETRHQPDDAMAMLTADHRQVRALFQQYADTSVPYLKQIIQALKATGLSILKPSIKMKPFHIVTPTQNTGDKESLAIIKESTTGKKRFSI